MFWRKNEILDGVRECQEVGNFKQCVLRENFTGKLTFGSKLKEVREKSKLITGR